MQKSEPVPDIVVGRLPIYLQALDHLLEQGREIIASKDLAEWLGIGSAQIRKDLSHFGEFGKQGTGYDVAHLRGELRRILNVDREWLVALVGAGDLGHAIVHHGGFEGRGFRIACVFDDNWQKIGRKLGGFQICDAATLAEQAAERDIRVGIVAVPVGAAQSVVDDLVAAGITAILNYAPITVTVPPYVHLQYIDPVTHLQHMAYYLEA